MLSSSRQWGDQWSERTDVSRVTEEMGAGGEERADAEKMRIVPSG